MQTSVIAAYMHASRLKRATTVQRAETTENCMSNARQVQGSRSQTEKLHEQREAGAGHRETARAVQSKCRASGQEKLHEQCKCRAAYHRERETARSARGKCSAASRSQRNCTSSEQVRETARAECRSQRNCMSSAMRVQGSRSH